MASSKKEIIEQPESETAALTEHKIKDNKTNAYEPSDRNIKLAKDWVDSNQK